MREHNKNNKKKNSILEYFTMRAFIFKCNKMLSGTIEISCRSCCLVLHSLQLFVRQHGGIFIKAIQIETENERKRERERKIKIQNNTHIHTYTIAFKIKIIFNEF